MRSRVWKVVAAVVVSLVAGRAEAQSPPQGLPSALLQYPLIEVEGAGLIRDTRIELLNLSNRDQEIQCFYVQSPSCGEIDFFVRLTPNQPVSWLASKGLFNFSGTAVPPFSGTGELKCIVLPDRPEVDFHNTIQGRAIVFDSNGQTISFGALAFRRLTDGEFEHVIELDGVTYTQCPNELHFAFLAADDDSQSELILLPCSQDLENLRPASTAVQFRIINEFEQLLSASLNFTCYDRRLLEDISNVFTRETLGTLTGHLIAKGVQEPVYGIIIDRFTDGALSTSGNEPFLRGGRPALVRFP